MSARGGRGRRCVGCGQRVAYDRVRRELVRMVFVPRDGGYEVAVDLAGSEAGRGAWLHPNPRCLSRATSKGLAQAASAAVVVDRAKLAADVVAATDRRLLGLLTSARRAKQLALGAAATQRAWRSGAAKLIVVAGDSAAGARLPEVGQAAQQGAVVCWGAKSQWGRALRARDAEVGVMGIESESIADAVKQTLALAEPLARSLREGVKATESSNHGTESASPGDQGSVVPRRDGIGARGDDA